jgi:predicted DNA-binding transcriptional regulator AlpA
MAERPKLPELAGAAEGRALLGLSQSTFDYHTRQPDFPEPAVRLKCGSIWLADDLRRWGEATAERRAKKTPRKHRRPKD